MFTHTRLGLRNNAVSEHIAPIKSTEQREKMETKSKTKRTQNGDGSQVRRNPTFPFPPRALKIFHLQRDHRTVGATAATGVLPERPPLLYLQTQFARSDSGQTPRRIAATNEVWLCLPHARTRGLHTFTYLTVLNPTNPPPTPRQQYHPKQTQKQACGTNLLPP